MSIDCTCITKRYYEWLQLVIISLILNPSSKISILEIDKLNMLNFINLIRGILPSKFDIFCPKRSLWSNCYRIRNPKYVLPKFKNEFMRKGFDYNIIVFTSTTPFVIDKIYTHSIQGLALYIKQCILDSYSNVLLKVVMFVHDATLL